ncbi:MAG: exonuclease domain-containing protein [Flavobacteriaceae bacterium]|jgi:DNA polymerase III subunit epsilon|nr:exonuclease domain-containing protein [Flavobacteriaceae bacterium]MDG1064381.1 exonuclease domain-containing protein [Flavobacteriaceae bacterium]MDG1961849.1 exonuclease domain-containing protein [Flavobacteriaceae bacterium]
MYAIVDIETTGGKYNEEGITEIAIYRYDGQDIVDQFCSLVNPERPIQPFVVNLTGINNAMLRQAPKFFEIAKRIVEITKDCVLVAHNAQFDYRIMCTEFERLGYPFEKQSLCTVELSKKLIPDQPSYSLGKLTRSLGIPLSDRHRAQGDALATVKLFKLLLDKDSEKSIVKNLIRHDPKKQLEPKLLDLIASAPTTTGVYYMHNKDGDIIYIGKSKNLKKRLTQHFTGEQRKAKKIQLEVADVHFEVTGNELIALLKESEEIKIHKPLYNRALRKTLFQYQLTSSIDNHGYINLQIEKSDKRKKAITTFTSFQQAKSVLFRITETYSLCQKLNGLYKSTSSCFLHGLDNCHGACVQQEDPETYNSRVKEFINKNSFSAENILIIDQGRTVDERSVVAIENGKYKGFGYFHLNFQIQRPEVLQSIIRPMQDNRDAQHIIQSYLRKHKVLKILKFNTED